MLNNIFTTTAGILTACLIIFDRDAQGNIINRPSDRFALDVSGCALYHKLCSHLDDDLAVLSCALNASYNNTQILLLCQHKLWSHQAELLDNDYVEYKLKEPCQEEPVILNCLSPNEYMIDCVLKKKSSVRDKKCWRMINKLESLVFNDWQIIGNFLKNCYDDIEAHTCGRIPFDQRSLSQKQTLSCLQGRDIHPRPECQAEMTVLEEMKYDTLQLDKIIFAACNLDQKNFCPDEVPGSWLMYKCLLRHKYENGDYFYSFSKQVV